MSIATNNFTKKNLNKPMQKTYLSTLLFLLFVSLSSNHASYGQCTITDSKDCEKTIYKVDVNKNTTEILFDSCGKTPNVIKFTYNSQKQCTGISMPEGTTKFTYDINKKLIKADLNASGTPIVNTYQYLGKNLNKIISKINMGGMKLDITTKYTYSGDNITRIEVSENLTNKKEIVVDSITYMNDLKKSNWDNNTQGIKDLSLGFYVGMGAFESLLTATPKPIKSYYLSDPKLCESLMKIEYEYEYDGTKPEPISMVQKKTCNGETKIEKHLISVDCK